MPTPSDNVARLLAEHRTGRRDAVDELAAVVYEDLRAIAERLFRAERPNNTLQPTALVHEAYIRLLGQRDVEWQNRAHFCGVAARIMRRLLVDHARARRRSKRGGDDVKVSLDEAMLAQGESAVDLVALDEALERLATLDPQQSSVVELRYFGGLSVEEAAEVLGVSTRTVKRDWSVARAWLHDQLSGGAR